jgi:hypothetical protein
LFEERVSQLMLGADVEWESQFEGRADMCRPQVIAEVLRDAEA